METVNYIENSGQNNILGWFIVDSMAESGIEKFGKFDSTKLEVELKINGVTVSVLPTFARLQKFIDECRKKVESADRQNTLTEVLDEIRQFIELKRDGKLDSDI